MLKYIKCKNLFCKVKYVFVKSTDPNVYMQSRNKSSVQKSQLNFFSTITVCFYCSSSWKNSLRFSDFLWSVVKECFVKDTFKECYLLSLRINKPKILFKKKKL